MKNTYFLRQWVITLQWNYNSNLINKKISKQEADRDNLNGSIIRIGRADPCNIKLEDISVSREHAEIYFNEQQEKFFIKTLASRNTTKVDGQDLVHGEELPLKKNSTIVLGLQKIEVNDIQIFDIEATNYSGIVNLTPISSAVNPNLKLNGSKHWWQEPTIQVALIGAIVTLVASFLTWNGNIMSRYTEEKKQKIALKAEREKQKIALKAEREKQEIELEAEREKQEIELEARHKKEYLDKFNNHLEKVRGLKRDQKGKFKQLTLENNNCSDSINVAVSFTALDDITQTRGWLVLEKGLGSQTTNAITNSSAITLYARTGDSNNKKLEWNPQKTPYQKKHIRDDEFNYIQQPFLDSDISDKGKEKVRFYKVDLSNSLITRKAFKCTARGSLELVDAE